MCLGLWRLLGVAGMSFGRALDEIWSEFLQKIESALGFSN